MENTLLDLIKSTTNGNQLFLKDGSEEIIISSFENLQFYAKLIATTNYDDIFESNILDLELRFLTNSHVMEILECPSEYIINKLFVYFEIELETIH